ncbi:Fur family transcriptional regulator [Sphingomonas sp. OTU376]|uniref:Fur family transcriptional regulator n=1 Tax=Sphingomonas sp. OTU376 TaxID=3043863 RepID=UPI00313E0B97
MSATGGGAMAGGRMAGRKRGAGFLHERVLRLLELRYPRPLTGLELVEMLLDTGEVVPPSQVYRALKRLIDAGEACKVLVAGGYVPAGPAPAMLFWCRGCGTVHAVACPELFARLEAGATEAGMRDVRSVVEVPGLCGRCAGRNPA